MRADSGHATAAPPSATSNSRRPMVTVIRPSRARCVKETIPRHERAVPNSAAPKVGGPPLNCAIYDAGGPLPRLLRLATRTNRRVRALHHSSLRYWGGVTFLDDETLLPRSPVREWP